MILDANIPLGQLYPDDEALRAAMLEVTRHTLEDRKAAWAWSCQLRLLTADTAFQPGTIEALELTDAEKVELGEICNCMWFSSRRMESDDTALMVTQTDDAVECWHYLAVSYCWDSSARAPYEGGPYSIRRQGNASSAACPASLLKRVIALAHLRGLRYLWIDQECIVQDDPSDKTIGISAMDIVYESAERSVAVLEAQISEQRHLDALGMLYYCDAQDNPSLEQMQDLMEALELLPRDPWFERAWCLQESTAAARRIELLVRRGPSLTLPDTFLGGSELLDSDLLLGLSDLHRQLAYWLEIQILRLSDAGHSALHDRGPLSSIAGSD